MAIVTYSYYEDFKQQFDSCMQATANNFVKIGYLLKQARDTDILKESGYSGMGEFAKAEYGLDNSTTSRFIAICDRYGAGNDHLLPKYAEYGYSKLAEMLTLPDSVADAITPEITKEEIASVGFRAADYDELAKKYDPEKLQYGYNEVDGETVYFISNPALGLWINREAFEA